MTKDTLHTCPICHGTSFQPYKLGLVACDACRVVLSPAIWHAQASEAMEDEWFGTDYAARNSFWTRLFETRNNRKTLHRISTARPVGLRLLEIGVGSGSFLNASRAAGYSTMGCDLSSAICLHVQQTYGIAMHNGPLSALTGEGRFDVIVMNHVLEHVHQPISFLKDVYRLLAPGGIAHIAVPNIACWEASLSGWTSYEPYHLSYFSPQPLRQTVAASGLSIERLSTHDSFSGWFLAGLRTLLGINREFGAVTRPITAAQPQKNRPRSGMIEHAYRVAMIGTGLVTWPLRLIQSRLGFGDEIICVARKPRID
jgi:2-polyprenyl-3-methyl-5-hydroxy-6-metoxy-1,4-benzoquinol methylase